MARPKPIKVAWVTSHDDGTRVTEILDMDEYLLRARGAKVEQAPPLPPPTSFKARLRQELLDAWFKTDFPADLVRTISRVFSRSGKHNKDEHSKAAMKRTLYRQQVADLRAKGRRDAVARVAKANGVSEKTVRRALKK